MEKHQDQTKIHVEQPARIRSIFLKLAELGLVQRCRMVPPFPVSMETVAMVHQREYVDRVVSWKQMTPKERMKETFHFISIFLNEHSTDAAFLSCGALVQLTDLVASAQIKNAVAVIRPPGHHAEHDHAMGFCIFNNVAVAAVHAKEKLGVKRILIVDWDVHHGNGTQHLLWEDPDILFLSLHRFDEGRFDPGGPEGGPSKTGGKNAPGKNVNIGWNTTDVGDESYLCAFERIVLPLCKEFDPELIFISAGFDSAKGDPLGQINITPAGYAQMTSSLMKWANGKVVVALEGGYNLDSISNSMAAVVATLLGDTPPETVPRAVPQSCLDSIQATIDAHKPFWKVFQ